jgi:hypothetical protein
LLSESVNLTERGIYANALKKKRLQMLSKTIILVMKLRLSSSGVRIVSMQPHRFREQREFAPVLTTSAGASLAGEFMVCPALLMQGWMEPTCPWQQIYQVAYERARAVVAPSRLERFLAASLN